MSLYLIAKDSKLIESFQRQLAKGAYLVNSLEKLETLNSLTQKDCCPIFLIDENFTEWGSFFPILEYLLQNKINGFKVLLTNKLNISKAEHFLSDEDIAILKKPFSLDQLIVGLVNSGKGVAIEEHLNKSYLAHFKELERKSGDIYSSILVGESHSIALVREIIAKIGPLFNVVHINGESGTGKEIVASLLKVASLSKGPFVAINCSAIPTSLADAYLFGHERGAYTDAKEQREGIVKAADNGILFLDEIEDLALEVQGKLLRLVETHLFRPLGSSKSHYSNFKLITASNISLRELCLTKRLRFDLYNRLNHLVISLAPLRERKEDIPLLIEHYKTLSNDKRPIDSETMALIMEYDWPGNVRELFKELNLLSVFAPTKDKYLSYRKILTESVFCNNFSEVASDCKSDIFYDKHPCG
ncbi:MAG: sigma 54-interacting transcriptional regulator [Sphaerochaetaceae bacterium]